MHRAKVKFAGSDQFDEISTDYSDDITWNGRTFNHRDVSFQSPVTGTIYGTLLNFKGQLELMKDSLHDKPYNAPPEKPIMYIKPGNTVNSHNNAVAIPKDENTVQVGAALGVVFGKTATNVAKDHVMDYIAGYTIVNDVSIPHESFYRPDIKNKVRDGFCPVGPWVIDRDAVNDPDHIIIRVYVNGELVQENNTKNLVRSVAQLISEVTDFMTLYKGDTLLVGVPEHAPLVKKGDSVRIELSEVGFLENTFVDEADLVPGGGQR
ncbi:4-hydroxyphenylacetate isomerase [Virgibacillus phasianinus]|uniref:4-hydroxyphenylacetate isomerase n=1 Tax=Virgibacillus phasianinus TaxID=2017483 RepID=A0A220U3F7_9BACI|nr:fumarylacetoacetate hydrolase family protein [Virgibacillus phasianinus]ASK62630.1 4-hydroxyphenylacetate isomerase [Virgibacillus phasianinus]